jgi:hypothetical protein
MLPHLPHQQIQLHHQEPNRSTPVNPAPPSTIKNLVSPLNQWHVGAFLKDRIDLVSFIRTLLMGERKEKFGFFDDF